MKYSTLKKAVLRRERNFNKFKKIKKTFILFPIISSITLLFISITVIGSFVWLFANLEWFELKSKNELGDAFGGLTNPIIAFIGVIVTFLAFYIQYKFNREQSKLIAQQRAERIQDKIENENENNFKYFSDEFLRIEKKIMDLNNSALKLKDDKVNDSNSHHFNKVLNDLIYIISIFNNLIKLIDLYRIDKQKDKNNFIDKYDRIILSNIYFLDKALFRDILEQYELLLELSFIKNLIDYEKSSILYKSQLQEYNNNLESIKVLLFAVYADNENKNKL